LPHPATIHPHKPGYPVGHSFIELQSVDSTNNYAMAHVHAGLAFPGTVFFAHEQFAGKGQRGKTWTTQPGENIMMSILLQPQFLAINRQFALSASIALACHDFSRQLAIQEAHIKWPNDLYWGDRKAGGILIENILQGNNWQYAITGIGININQTAFPPHLSNPVSLKQLTGKTYDPVALAKELCLCIETRYVQLQQEDFGVILNDYNAVLYKKNQVVLLKKENIIFETVVKEVNAGGQLQTSDSIERTFNFGEVEWVRKDGQ
jgi:BirA family transcriptional regulator, biotin operon repressor / biotin---[acetyl-CoA-carboxylase] ligase